jgi:hypothetical protein
VHRVVVVIHVRLESFGLRGYALTTRMGNLHSISGIYIIYSIGRSLSVSCGCFKTNCIGSHIHCTQSLRNLVNSQLLSVLNLHSIPGNKGRGCIYAHSNDCFKFLYFNFVRLSEADTETSFDFYSRPLEQPREAALLLSRTISRAVLKERRRMKDEGIGPLLAHRIVHNIDNRLEYHDEYVMNDER